MLKVPSLRCHLTCSTIASVAQELFDACLLCKSLFMRFCEIQMIFSSCRLHDSICEVLSGVF